MTIHRNRYGFDDEISFECDACGAELHTEQSGFDAAKEMAKREGWKIRKIVGEWMHFCEGCEP